MTELSLKIKNNLAEKIYKISKNSNKPFAYHINEALKSYIEEQNDLEAALNRLKDKNDKAISSKEIRKRLGI
ncbi:MAG: DNA-binding protein [bacterium]